MSGPRLVASFASSAQFLQAFRTEIASGGLLIRGAQLGAQASVGPCTVAVEVGAHGPLELEATVAAFIPNMGVAVLFKDLTALRTLAGRLESGAGESAPPEEPPPQGEDVADEPALPGTMSARLKLMSVTEKMQLGLAGDREARIFLFRDTNKALHLYVLRNPRIGLDEVTAAAKMSTLGPDALKFIAEHKEWGLNPTVCTALARNPRTPVPLVLRILPRVPLQEIRAIAKGNGRAPIVQAARKLLND